MDNLNQRKSEKKDKTVQITVNGTSREWNSQQISYEEAVDLAYGTMPNNPRIHYSITYKRGQGNGEQGTIAKGQSIKVTHNMKIYVTHTNQS